MAGSFSHVDRTAQREQDRMQRALGLKVNKEPEASPIFGPPVKVKRAHDPLRTEVQNLLGSYEDVKGVIGQSTTQRGSSLIGVVPQPSTPVSTKVKGGNPFANLGKKQEGQVPSVPNVKQEKKNIVNGQHQSRHGQLRGEAAHARKVKSKESGTKVGNVGHRPEERTGVFDKFQNWENVESKLNVVSSSQNEPRVREHPHKERKDKRKSSDRDAVVRSEDRSSSHQKRKDSHSRERSKSRSETKDEIHNVTSKTESSGHDVAKGAVSSENKLNGASSAASTPNSQKSTASSGYCSLKPTNSVLSQPHVSPVPREHRDSDASLKSTPSPDIPVFQSPPSRTSNIGKPPPPISPLKSPNKLPNGLSKDIKKHKSMSDHSKKVLKLDMTNQEDEGKEISVEKIFQEMSVEPPVTGIITPQKNVQFPFSITARHSASQNLFNKHSKHDKSDVRQPSLERHKSMGAPDGSTLLNDLNLSSDSENEEQVPNNTRKPSTSASMKRRASRSISRTVGSSSSSSGSSSEGSDSESSSSDNEDRVEEPSIFTSPTLKPDSPPTLQEESNNVGKYALKNFIQTAPKAPGMSVLGPLSDSDQPGSNEVAVDDTDDHPLSSEHIADAADTDDDGDDLLVNILKAAVEDKLPDPIAEHMESPPPPKLEPNIITPPSSVGSNHGKVLDFGGPPSYKPPETPPLSNKAMTKQESSPVATAKSPVNSNNTKSSGRPSTGKSPRRGRPPKNKPKEDISAQVNKPAISASKDTASGNKKSVSRQKSATKSKNTSEADKKKTVTSVGNSNKRGRPPKVKSPKSKMFISSSEESSSSESDSSSENSDDEDEVDWKPVTVKSSPSSAKSPKDSKNGSILLKRTSPGRADLPRKPVLTGSPKKLLEDSPVPTYVTPSMDSELDLEEVFSATKFSPYTDITAPEPMLSPLPNRDCTTPFSRTTQILKAATSPTKSSPMSSIPAASKSNAAAPTRKNSQSGSDENKLGVTYVDGRPCVMVRIDLAKLDKWPSRRREPSGSDVEQQVSAFIKDGKSLLEVKQMPSVVEPLPPSPAPRVHSDSISTSSEFSDGEIKDSDDDKSDSENEISDSNNNSKQNVNKDNKSDSSSSSSDESDDEEDNKSVSESVSSEIKKEDISNKEQAATDNTENAAASPAPNSKKLTASGQKEVLNQIFKHNEKPSLSSVKIPKKRPQSPHRREDHKRARTDHNRHSDYSHRDRVNHKDDREWDRKHPPRLEHSPRPLRNESPRPLRGTESPRPRERAGSTGSTSSRHSHYERDREREHRRGRNEGRTRDRERERDRDRDRHYERDRERTRSPWEPRSSRHHNVCDWDAPPEDTDGVHAGSSPHFNGQHSAAKDWSVLAGGGTIPHSQETKPKWVIPEPENEDGKPEDYLSEAKRLKHQADELEDRLAKSLMYVEAVLSFIRCGNAMESEKVSEPSKIYCMYKDTLSLLKHICKFRGHESNIPPQKEKKLSVLSLRIQSMLYLKLFKLKKSEAGKLRRAIEDHNKSSAAKPPAAQAPSPYQPNWNSRGTTGTPSPISPTPSPAGSVGSVGSVGSGNGTDHRLSNGSQNASISSSSTSTVTITSRIHSITQQYLSHMSNLYQCHDLWDQADAQTHHYQEFFDELEHLCGPLTLHSSILDLVRYVRCGVHMLKDT